MNNFYSFAEPFAQNIETILKFISSIILSQNLLRNIVFIALFEFQILIDKDPFRIRATYECGI
jgi:ethanolamine utilization cobalamin adenosyltransferase